MFKIFLCFTNTDNGYNIVCVQKFYFFNNFFSRFMVVHTSFAVANYAIFDTNFCK